MSQYKELSIPVSVVGSGSKPEDEDGMVLDYMPMPNDMSVFQAPVIMDDSIDKYPDAHKVVLQVIKVLGDFSQNEKSVLIDLGNLPLNNLDFINRFFGEGEVSIIYNEEKIEYRIQETVLAGVWRIAGRHENQPFQAIEVGKIPQVIYEQTFNFAQENITLPDILPQGVINAPSLLMELSDKSQSYKIGDDVYVINLTLLPQSVEDLDLLVEYLGKGLVVILSRGYGSCRVSSTNLKYVWWVQYFNSEDKLILNTLEVIDVPIVTQASTEDILDSFERIKEMLDTVNDTQ